VTVWVLLYEHRHGRDISVHWTEEDAVGTAAAIIGDWLDEIDDEDALKRIEASLDKGKYTEAIKAWRAYQLGSMDPEFLEWSSHRVGD